MKQTVPQLHVQRINSNATTTNAYRQFGYAIKTTTALITLTKNRTARIERVVLKIFVAILEGAFLIPGFVMAIRTACRVKMSRIPVAIQIITLVSLAILSARIIDAYRAGGDVIMKAIAEIIQMRLAVSQETVPNRNLDVVMENVFVEA